MENSLSYLDNLLRKPNSLCSQCSKLRKRPFLMSIVKQHPIQRNYSDQRTWTIQSTNQNSKVNRMLLTQSAGNCVRESRGFISDLLDNKMTRRFLGLTQKVQNTKPKQ